MLDDVGWLLPLRSVLLPCENNSGRGAAVQVCLHFARKTTKLMDASNAKGAECGYGCLWQWLNVLAKPQHQSSAVKKESLVMVLP